MRSKYSPTVFRSLAIAALSILLATSCKSPRKTDTEAPAAGGGAVGESPAGGQPVVQDRDILTDPQGSDSGAIQGLSTIFFEFDQARLTSNARQKLAENAEWIRNHPNFTVQIEGHTDNRGSVEYNLSLGERRAKSVKSYLEGLGVDPRRMNIISYGEEKPLESGDSESAWGKNRRANFVPLQ